jgi:transaldolase
MSTMGELLEHGQSVWLDYIRRDLIDSGELGGLVDSGLRGMTSNPTIFQKAIGDSTLYDDRIRAFLADHGDAGANDLYEHLAVADIRDAADVLRPVFDAADGADGFVSLEVSPALARDTAGTIAEAHRLRALVDRPNILIKVPATTEGVPAIEALIADGIHVNVTLMFSMDHYEAVANAYIDGLRKAAHPDRIASVASFFVSRVDTKVDAALEKVGSPEALALRGKIAVANSRRVYRRFRELFGTGAFDDLRARGARPQRVLWASTSTKNPDYRDVFYVEELIGPDTVNTMPPATLDAFIDHGVIAGDTVMQGVDEAEADVAELANLGIDLDAITAELQVEGVDAFAASFDDLMDTLTAKAKDVAS